ncbi:MAG: DUF1992 domain-containing protein [Rhodobacteraceae bacterium]|nr:DUF1992 domain-containing protein [Paracoccaceae bacterium]
MDHPLIELMDQRIREAEADGAFDNLPGAGKPLPECDDPQNALLNRLVKENGARTARTPWGRTMSGRWILSTTSSPLARSCAS